ncbi:PH domain-containing protein [Halomonas sp. LR3S48]|uniref:PH domain-containing protein n=1 Tax=Halomonas sp. LR3S48 TaxID=2982694 RepID=UPI0021E48348|nr:PH domain-containing protein [Halomonas sp. LR3S48]UYG05471.1 PH domain-containing protein [Halomonas sp. LR3S48]
MSEEMRPGDTPSDLSQWQRLSPWAVILLLLSGATTLLRQHMPLVLGAGASLALLERVGWRELALGGALLLGLAVLVSLLYYRRFRYRFDGDVLIVQKGLLEHREFKMASRHVQHVAIHQPAYMRPFRLVLWEVETLAGEASRITLPGIRRDRAEALGQRLRATDGLSGAGLDRQPGAYTNAKELAHGDEPLFAITYRAIALHGLASRSIYVIAAMLSPLVRPLERWLHERLPQLDLAAWLPASLWVAVPLGIVAIVTLLALLAVLAAWWRFHGYVLRDEGDRQVQISGLFNRQEQALSLARLQVVEWVQTGLGRLLGRGYLVCHQFGALGGDAAESRRFVVPGLTRKQGGELMARLWSGYCAERPLQRVDASYRRVLLLRHALLLGVVATLVLVPFASLELPASVWGGLVGVVLLASAGLAQLRWMATAWAVDGDYLRIRRGVLGQRTGIFPMHHLITLSLQQSWLQRRRGVATLQLELANGRQSLPYLKEAEARRLADTLLYRVEAGQAA